MGSNAQVRSGGGVSFAGLLGIVFIVLKLTGVIAWSWWWVLAPFWIPLVLLGIVLITALIVVAVDDKKTFGRGYWK